MPPSASYAMAAVPPGFRVSTAVHPTLQKPTMTPLPTNLLDDAFQSPPQTPSPPAIEKKHDSFEDTTLREFCEWFDGRRECLSPMAASDLGFDQWLYQLRKAPLPSAEQEHELKRRIWDLANESPLKLWHAIQTRKLPLLLGNGFEWVQVPKNW